MTNPQGSDKTMLDYIREDIKDLRDDVREDIQGLRNDMRAELAEIKSTIAVHTKSDADNFAAFSDRLSSIERSTSKLSAVSSFRSRLFSQTTTWIIAVAALIVGFLRFWKAH
jgi:hypothetical protein